MRDVLGHGVLAADGARVHAVALARLAHCVVSAVEVLPLLQVLREVVRLRRQLAVQPEQTLLIGGEGLCQGEVRVSVDGCHECVRADCQVWLDRVERAREGGDGLWDGCGVMAGRNRATTTDLDVNLVLLMRIHFGEYVSRSGLNLQGILLSVVFLIS